MHPRHPVIRGLLAALVAGVLSSCAHAPPALEETEGVPSIRADYLRNHPAGQYNEFIRRGEVVRGMTYLEVLASWGYPEARLRVPKRGLEYWRYLARDDVSGDWIQYTFVFEDNALLEWEMTRHHSKGRAMAHIEFDDPTELPTEEMLPPDSRAAVKR
jgi:hypothetical protein